MNAAKKPTKTDVRCCIADVRALLRDVESAIKNDDMIGATYAAQQAAASAIQIEETMTKLMGM